MHAYVPASAPDMRDDLTAVRRFRGPVAEEVFVLCRAGQTSTGAGRQAEALYRRLLDALAAEGLGPGSLVAERLFLRRAGADAAGVAEARARILGPAPSAATFIGQPPVTPHAALELAAIAVRPHAPDASIAGVRVPVACACPACGAGCGATVLRMDEEAHLYAGNVYGVGDDAFAEAYDMFRVADALLAAAGMRFADVMRTWIHVRDIARDYAALNDARRAFFRDRGIDRRPASTGVQGIPAPDAHAFSLGLYALRSAGPIEITPMSTRLLNEAWTYGADFSRGLRVADANKLAVHVSGTASIDEEGRTAHPGDFAAQAHRMLDNVASLLAEQGAGFGDVVSGIAYVADATDAERLRMIFRERGFDGVPCALVESPLCRPDLLCETEAVALLPRPAPGARRT